MYMHEEVPGADSALESGAMVTHNIRLARKLGDGGMGTVWLADHLGLGSQVVIKFMSAELARDPRWAERFRREAELAARVRHPHVVQVFDHGVTTDGIPFIAMELLEGHDLGQEIWDRERLLPGEVATIVVQVGKALQRVHEIGLVHRDVKPENIFLCDLGSGEIFIKLLDFGIAKTRHDEASSLTSTGITMGTPYYMSPEVIVSSKDVDQRADLWALAVVAFEALTGQRPFLGETIAGVALQLHAEKRPRATNLVPSLPAAIDGWFDRALSLDPEQRFPEARAMTRAFAAILPPIRNSFTPDALSPLRLITRRDETAPVATTQAVEPSPPPTRSKWPLVAGISVLAIVAAAVAWPSTTPTVKTPAAPGPAAPIPAAEEPKAVEVQAPVASAPVVIAAPSASAPKAVATAPSAKKPSKAHPHVFNDIE